METTPVTSGEHSLLFSISEGQAVLFRADPRACDEHEIHWLAQKLLSLSEREKAGQFFTPDDSRQYVVARALLRLGLSSCFAVEAESWRFRRDENDRPFVAEPAEFCGIHFSLTHTRELIALLITAGQKGGVDVEKTRWTHDLPAVAERIFTEGERERAEELPMNSWTERFFQLWTLKEAYAKARGLGMKLPFQEVSFDLAPGGEISACFGPELEDEPERWQFSLQRIQPDHCLATAVHSEVGYFPEIQERDIRVRASATESWLENVG